MEQPNEWYQQRLDKVAQLREQGVNPYANDFQPTQTLADVAEAHAEQDGDTLAELGSSYAVAGRIMARRDFGKAGFIQLQDRTARLQVYINKGTLGDETFELYRGLDIGDIVGIVGEPFRTKTR